MVNDSLLSKPGIPGQRQAAADDRALERPMDDICTVGIERGRIAPRIGDVESAVNA